MLRTPSFSRSGNSRNPLKAFKKGGKDGEQLAKTAPNTPEEETGVTVVANEIDPTRDSISSSVLQQIYGEHRSSPLRGDHRSSSSASANVREEKKEDPIVAGVRTAGPDDVVSKTLNFIDDFCNLPQVNGIANDNGVQEIAESSIQKHPYLLSHNSAYDDNTTSPSLPSETTGASSSAEPYSRSTKSSRKKGISQAGAHNHENFEVVLDPASVIKELRSNPSKQTRGNRLKNISMPFKKKKPSPGPRNDDSSGAVQLKAHPRREKAEEVPVDEEYGRLLGVNNESDQVEPDSVEEKPEDDNQGDTKSTTSAGGPKVLAKKIWKSFKKTPQKGEQPAEPTSAEAVAPSVERKKNLEEQAFLQSGPKKDVEPIAEEDEVEGNAEKVEPKDKEQSLTEEQKNIKTLEAMVPMRQSVEVVNKKPSTGTISLGRRLKKIQNSAFMSGRKGTKKSGQSKQVASAERSATPGAVSADSDGIPTRKPKQVWKSVVDPNTGRMYYYHRKTRETTWTKPEALKRYEVAYQKWIDATVAATGKETATAKAKNAGETKAEERAPTASTPSPSVPKTVSDDVEKNGKANDTDVVRTSTPARMQKTRAPVQMSVKEAKKDVPSKEQKVVAVESKNGAKAAEKEAKARIEKSKQPIDESKPFDEATPFDEPMAESNGPGLLFLPRSPPRFGRTMTYMSKASARSALTDRTEKVRNTGKGKFSSFNPISENTATSTPINSFKNQRQRVPSRVPIHRERQLMVEELTDARLSAESYEGKAGEKRGRIVRGRVREVEPTPETLYDGDNDTDDYGTSNYDNDTYGTDSVSALSENDTDFLNRRDNFDQARRRALDAAIEIEDWDLAAALSDGMRAANLPGGYEKAHSSWNQSELDKFIANNDWNAVKSYIARMREQSKKEQVNGSRVPKAPPANKRVGSQSQMQHNREVMSESSWSGSDSQSSYDDETYDSESEV